jgi:hypothetical protein
VSLRSRRLRAPGGNAGGSSTLEGRTAIELYWLPLGAGGHSVRFNGRVYEAVAAWLGRRPAQELYHSALIVRTPAAAFVIEQAPVRDDRGADRGVVAEGPVVTRRLRWLRPFRYEIRRWRDGVIPDVAEAVESPRWLSGDAQVAARILELVPAVPTPAWGRDELRLGEMWNSNSVVAWLLASSGLDAAAVRPPRNGRAPGWTAGLAAARASSA